MIALKPHLQHTADQYKLRDWVAKPDERRKKYFSGIDEFKRVVNGMIGQDPLDNQTISFLMQTLEGDRTFTGHIMKWQNGAKLTEEAFWKQLFEAGAVLLLMAHTEACAQEKWPA